MSITPVYDDKGEIANFIAIHRDVSERNRASQELQESREVLSVTLEIMRAGVWEWDVKSNQLKWSKETFALLGYSGDEVEIDYENWISRLHPEDKDRVTSALEEAYKNHSALDVEFRVVLPRRKIRWIEDIGRTLLDEQGHPTKMVGLQLDISERKEAEERIRTQQQQLLQVDRMATLGVLVSGVAHEINNPNNSISLNVPLLTRIWQEVLPILDKHREESGDFKLGRMTYGKVRGEIPKILEDIGGGSRRIRDIVERLKNFARMEQGEQYKPVQVNEVVEGAVALPTGLIKKKTRNLSVDLADDVPKVQGNFQEIEQIVINLISNACEALQDRNREARIPTKFDSAAGQVLVSVADEGSGISEENLNKIMDPFFTTKRSEGGTGLGLSISLNIAHEHGGVLEYSSSVGAGTIATLRLPAKL